MTSERFQAVTSDDVMSVYSGKPGKCCCGCSGAHRYNPVHRAELRARGYMLDDKSVNGAQVLKVLRLVQAADAEGKAEYDDDDAYVSAEVAAKLYIVYFVPCA